MMKERKSIFASIALVLVALVWGTSYGITKNILEGIPPFSLMTIRFIGATTILSIIYFKKFLKVSKNDLKKGLIVGIALFGAFLNLIMGIQYTAVSKQTFLIGSFVIIVPFLRWLMNKKKPDIFSILGAGFAFVGLAMLTLKGVEGINKGDIYSLVCAFFLHFIWYYLKDTPLTLIPFF